MILHCLVMQVKLGWLLGICMSGVRFNNEQSSKNCVSMSWVGLNKSSVSQNGGDRPLHPPWRPVPPPPSKEQRKHIFYKRKPKLRFVFRCLLDRNRKLDFLFRFRFGRNSLSSQNFGRGDQRELLQR